MTELSVWAKLDPFRAAKEIEAAVGHAVFTSAAYSDPERFYAELEAEFGIEITPFMALDTNALVSAVNDALEEDEGEGGGGELPEAPDGFAYLVNANGDTLLNADDAYILGKV